MLIKPLLICSMTILTLLITVTGTTQAKHLTKMNDSADSSHGSVLIYNYYTSRANTPDAENTVLTITNSGGKDVWVRLYFICASCLMPPVSEACQLAPGQTKDFEASEFDPEMSGFAVAVAVDSMTGAPINFNFLTGSALVKLASGHSGQLKAEAFKAYFTGVLPTEHGQARLDFNGRSYSHAPREVVGRIIPGDSNNNRTLLVINPLDTNLVSPTAELRVFEGVALNDKEDVGTFSFNTLAQQFRVSLLPGFPHLTESQKLASEPSSYPQLKLALRSKGGLLGAVFHLSSPGTGLTHTFTSAHNLRASGKTPASWLILPVLPQPSS